jgi:hypothetical protein
MLSPTTKRKRKETAPIFVAPHSTFAATNLQTGNNHASFSRHNFGYDNDRWSNLTWAESVPENERVNLRNARTNLQTGKNHAPFIGSNPNENNNWIESVLTTSQENRPPAPESSTFESTNSRIAQTNLQTGKSRLLFSPTNHVTANHLQSTESTESETK